MSLRKSLIVAFAILLTLVGGVGALFAYTSAKREAWDIMDFQQRQISKFIGDGSALLATGAKLPNYNSDEDYVIQLRSFQGVTLQQTGTDLVFPATLPDGFSTFVDGEGTWRIFSRKDDQLIVNVAQRTSERDELATDAAINSAMPFLFAVPLSWLVVYVLVGAIFRRLDEIVRSVEKRSFRDTNPLPLDGVPIEIRPLLKAVNDAFNRIKVSVDQQQQFLSDAAHELRTPLAALTLQIGNLKTVESDEHVIGRLEPLDHGIKRAARVATQLLQLARQDAEHVPTTLEVIALDQLLLGVMETLFPLAQEKKIDLGLTHMEHGNTIGSRQDLVILLDTILENALKYTPNGGTVDIDLTFSDETAILTIKDTGPGISAEAIPRVFDRFFRAANQDEDGTGLGLSIAKSIAQKHQIEINLSNREDRSGLIAELRFKAQ